MQTISDFHDQSMQKTIHQICKPLQDRLRGIRFRYYRRNDSNKTLHLSNSSELLQFYYDPDLFSFHSPGFYQLTWLDQEPYNYYQTGELCWAISRLNNTDTQNDFLQFIHRDLNVHEGITLIQKQNDYVEFFEFTHATPEVYHLTKSYLYQFAYYFQDQVRSMLHSLVRSPYVIDRHYLHTHERMNLSEPMILGEKSDERGVCDNRFYVNALNQTVYFTQKEFTCLRLLAQGKTAKQTAIELALSYKTVERHIDNMRKKTGCRTQSGLLKIAMDAKLL